MDNKKVHEVMEELSNAHYQNDIISIAAIAIDKNGEMSVHMALETNTAYAVNTGFDVIKQHLINDIVNYAGTDLKKRDM